MYCSLFSYSGVMTCHLCFWCVQEHVSNLLSAVTWFLNGSQKPGFLNRGKGLKETRLTQADFCRGKKEKKKNLISWSFTHVTAFVTVTYTWAWKKRAWHQTSERSDSWGWVFVSEINQSKKRDKSMHLKGKKITLY